MDERITKIINEMLELKERERLVILERFCRRCGTDNESLYIECQCWNDE